MFKISMSSISGACVIAMCLLSSGVSSAGSVGSNGFALPFSDLSCFALSDGAGVVNNCATTRSWLISDNITAAGNHPILVTGFRPNGGQLTCAACATTKEGALASCTFAVSLAVVDTHTQFNVGTVTVPSFGSLYVRCDMTTGGRVDSVTF
jgi:hypothetical protein